MFLMFLGCATRVPVVAPPPPALSAIEIDASAMFDGDFGASLVESRLLPGWMDRVLLPDAILQIDDDDVPIERWARRLLILTLSSHGSKLVLPLRDGHLDDRPRLPPTSALRAVAFVSGSHDRHTRRDGR